jgi:hypothetical protein
MAEYSFPFTSNTGDRVITAAQQRALYAALVGSGILEQYAGSVSGTTLSITAGAAIIDGAFHDAYTGVSISLASVVGTNANIVAKLDETARSITLVVKETDPVNAGGVHEVLVGTITKVGGIWQTPVFSNVLAVPFRFAEAAAVVAAAQADIDALQTATEDTGWIASSTGITATTGWSLSMAKYRRIGKVVSIYVQFKRTGAAVTVNADGNIANIQVGTLPAGITPSSYQSIHSGSTGRVCTGNVSNDAGIYLAAIVPGSNIDTNDEISLGGTYFL